MNILKKELDSNKLIYNMGIILYVFGLLIKTSTYSLDSKYIKIIEIMQIMGLLLLSLKILLDVTREKFSLKKMLIIFFLLICMFLTYIRTDDYATTVNLIILLIASHNMNFKKTIKIIFYVELLGFIFILLSCKVHIIEDYIINRETETNLNRHALGFIHPNILMLTFFSIVVMFLYIKKEKINMLYVLVLTIINLILYRYTDSRMGTFITEFAIICFYFVKMNKTKDIFWKFKSIIPYIVIIFAVLSVILTIAYDKVNLEKINEFSSNRLELQFRAWNEYGITLFGQKIEWVGQGITNKKLIWKDYNYVDNSYVKAIVNYGVIFFVIIMYGEYYVLKKSCESRDVYTCVAVVLVGIYSITDVSLLRVLYNPYIILMFPVLNFFSTNKEE